MSEPAQISAMEVLLANNVEVLVDDRGRYTPTPAVSHAILAYNSRLSGGVTGTDPKRADGIVITPSHNPPRDGGFKYNPPNGGPADTDATDWIAERANNLLRGGLKDVKRVSVSGVLDPKATKYNYMDTYVADLPNVVNLDVIRESGLSIGADPMGGASVDYWGAIAEAHKAESDGGESAGGCHMAVHDAGHGRQDSDGLFQPEFHGVAGAEPRQVRHCHR